jgi:hypothetical protein
MDVRGQDTASAVTPSFVVGRRQAPYMVVNPSAAAVRQPPTSSMCTIVSPRHAVDAADQTCLTNRGTRLDATRGRGTTTYGPRRRAGYWNNTAAITRIQLRSCLTTANRLFAGPQPASTQHMMAGQTGEADHPPQILLSNALPQPALAARAQPTLRLA